MIFRGRIFRGFKIDPPEVRSWRQELDADAYPAVTTFAEKDDPALLFLLRLWVDEHEYLAVVDLVLQHQQAAMRADHQSFAHFAELAAFMAAAERLQSHLVKDSLASAHPGLERFVHCPHLERRQGSGQVPGGPDVLAGQWCRPCFAVGLYALAAGRKMKPSG